MKLRILFLTAMFCCVSGCKTQSAMTADATGCRSISVDIVKTRYTRDGSTTVWCAKCKNTLYHCVSNPERSRVECKEAGPDMCQ
ncbi:MAG TPA: hypothetical protein VHB46_09505 [Burkholderiales bacterium]|nr:hypothetical protein [Burkholderiales bacterium]